MIIAIDFDGTCVKHEYPKVGETLPGAVETLKRIVDAGHQIIIYTMRSGQFLDSAKRWYDKNDIKWFSANINPSQKNWTNSPKVYAHLYIDDAALGIPLTQDSPDDRPYVEWGGVSEILEDMGII